MAVLTTAVIPGATQEPIDGMEPLLDAIGRQKGQREITFDELSDVRVAA